MVAEVVANIDDDLDEVWGAEVNLCVQFICWHSRLNWRVERQVHNYGLQANKHAKET